MERAETVMRLYNEGLTDREMAKMFETESHDIYCWRKIHGLPPNLKNRGGADRSGEILELYNKGYSDVEIQNETGVSYCFVSGWRRANGYEKTSKSGRPRKLYSVWLNKTDELLCYGTAIQCAEIMGLGKNRNNENKEKAFHTAKYQCWNYINRKYTIMEDEM